MRNLSLTLLLLAALAPIACSDDTQALTPDAQVAAPDAKIGVEATVGKDGAGAVGASFSELKAYDSVKGTASIKAQADTGVTKLELLVNGKSVATLTASPWTFSWDTVPTPDGIVKLSLKAEGAGGASTTSKELPIVVLNTGIEVTWKDGNTGKVIVPATGYVDQHIKHHWDMPEGIKQVVAILGWEKEGFKLELTIGAGECPDNGTIAAKADSETSPFAIEYPKTAAGTLGKGMWFSHVQLMNSTAVLGKETAFTLKTYLLK